LFIGSASGQTLCKTADCRLAAQEHAGVLDKQLRILK
jgi:hypothetical protein